ncbi:MAG: aldo/keto reductase [Candidatus Aminicenantales bacterium]
MKERMNQSRREFIKNSACAVLGVGLASREKKTSKKEDKRDESLKIKNYRILGRTGFRVSDIGAGFVQDAGLLSALLDSGVNYIDTAESYGTQRMIGSVIKNRTRRDLFITSKLEIKKDVSKEGFLKRTRKCLEELQTDYIDCMMMHMPERAETLKTEGFHAAMEQLKNEGRIRFVGVSHHGSFWFRDPEETMDRVLLAAAEDGRFDLFLMAYNFLQMDRGERVLQVCREKNIGVALMKTTPVVKYYGLKERIEALQKEGKEIHELYLKGLERFKEKAEKAESFIKKHNLKNPEEIRDAAVRFVLSNPNVHTACCSMRNFDDLRSFVRLSGSGLDEEDKERLAAYKKACSKLYCRHACGVCEPDCPHQVPVNTIMRYNHYFEAQGREKYAMVKYSAIPGTKAEACRNCPGYCEAACPYDVPIQGLLLMAHQQLSLA